MGTLVFGLVRAKDNPLDYRWFLHTGVGVFWFKTGPRNDFDARLKGLFSYLFLDTLMY